jgi:hypothetical protein
MALQNEIHHISIPDLVKHLKALCESKEIPKSIDVNAQNNSTIVQAAMIYSTLSPSWPWLTTLHPKPPLPVQMFIITILAGKGMLMFEDMALQGDFYTTSLLYDDNILSPTVPVGQVMYDKIYDPTLKQEYFDL